jgi:ABC-2 type transport system permease protein
VFKFGAFGGLAALLFREGKIWWGLRYLVFTSLFTPLLYFFLLGTGMREMMGEMLFNGSPVDDYILFLTPGIIGMGIVSTAISSGTTSFNERQWGTFERVLTLPVSRSSYVLAKILVAMILSIGQLLFILLVGIPLVEGGLYCDNIGLVLLATLLGVVCFCSLITPIALSIKSSTEFYGLTGIMLLPIILCSSAFYPLEAMPSWLRIIAYINPMTYMVDVLRAGFVGPWGSQIFWELLILCAFTIFFLAISIISLRRTRI